MNVLHWSKKSRVAGLVLVGLVAGLLSPGAERAPAAPGESDNLAEYSACAGAALADAGFEDVAGTSLESVVNCLSYYGVTRGRSDGLFSPKEAVTRWQMALFLARASRPAGITLTSAPADQGFTDLDELSAEARTDVNRLAQAGIMPGTSPGHFDPNRPVTRESMATILDAFLRRAVIGTGGTSPANVNPDDAVFTDIGGISRLSYEAIRRVYELGITRGVGGSRFAPSDPVTRGQMALFITRTLAHTIARPAGVTVQAQSTGSDPVTATESTNVELAVTVRDPNFTPLPNAPVDIFTVSGTSPAFNADGTCIAGRAQAESGSRACRIDRDDETTDSNGFLLVEVQATEALTVRAWNGAVGDEYEADTAGVGSLDINTVKEANQLLVADDLDDHQEKLHFGETVVFTVSVADVDDNPVPEENQAVSVTQIVTGADGSVNRGTRVYRTDAAGEIQVSFTQNDADADQDGPDATVALLIVGTNLPVRDKTTNGTDDDGRYQAAWSDDAPVETTLDVSQAKDFTPASDAGAGASHMVTAVLTDQYGDPVRRKTVFFSSNDQDGIGTADDGSPRYQRVTNRSGEAVFSYQRDNADSRVETITALYYGATAAASDDLSTERLYHYWTVEPDRGDRFTARLVKADLENNQVALLGNEAWLISYDGNDQLNKPDGPTDLDGFEKALEEEEIAHIAVNFYSDQDSGVSSLVLRNRWPELAIPDRAEHDDYAFVFASDNGVIAVGSPNDDVTDSMGDVQQGAGAVYVYDGPDDAFPARLTSSSPVGAGKFGYSLDIRGDVIAVGHPGGGSSGKGAVEVFVKPAGGWDDSNASSVWHDLSNAVGPASTANYEFGKAVALSGDGTKLAAAAPGRGRAYLFTISGPGASNQDGSGVPVLVPADASGFSSQHRRAFAMGGPTAMLSVSEDGSTVAGGAYSLPGSTGAAEAGAVYVFAEPGGGWNATAANQSVAKLTDAEAERGEWLGWSVAVTADGSTVVSGAHATDHHESRALIFIRPAGGWASTGEPTAELSTPSGEPLGEEADDFGQYADISDDGRIIASSRAARPVVDDHLREPVHIFTRPAGGWTSSAPDSVQQLAPRRWIRFGWGTSIDHSTGQVLSAEAVVPHRIYLITP